MKKAIVVLSGGQDSTTCLFWAKKHLPDHELHAVTFDYNQRHSAELQAAAKVAQLAEVRGAYHNNHEVVTLGPILKGASPLVSDNKLEQYKDHSSLPGGLEKTFVPMRNQLFLTLAMNRAAVIGADTIITGVCEEDYGGYPDCRDVFIKNLEGTSNLGLYGLEMSNKDWISILTPLMKLTKAQTVKLALDLPGCYPALAYTHTAYDGAYPPTGKDHATLLRAKGFEEATVPDPLVLRAWQEGLMELPDTPNYKDSPNSERIDYWMEWAGLE